MDQTALLDIFEVPLHISVSHKPGLFKATFMSYSIFITFKPGIEIGGEGIQDNNSAQNLEL